jgi:hypothetical protein
MSIVNGKSIRLCLITTCSIALLAPSYAVAVTSDNVSQAMKICARRNPDDPKLAAVCAALKAQISPSAHNHQTAEVAGTGATSASSAQEKRFNQISGAQPAPKPVPVNVCAPAPRIFVRADPLDDLNYLVDATTTKKGASLSFTDNYQQKWATLTTAGRLSLLLFGDPCLPAVDVQQPYVQGYAVAPWVSANGTVNSPQKKGEQNALKFGVDGQIALHSPGPIGPMELYLSGAPYYQTDFRGVASAAGGYLALTPVIESIALGESRPINFLDADVAFLLRGEFDYLHVYNVGYTDLTLGERPIAGAVGRIVFDLFRSTNAYNVPPELADRVTFFITGQYFYNFQTASGLPYFSAALSYKIYTGPSGGGADTSGGDSSGGSAISLEYDRGYDKDTQVLLNQLLLKLTFAY